jgi:hypothetical protein
MMLRVADVQASGGVRIGDLLVTATGACTPKPVLRGFAFEAACAVAMSNVGRHTIYWRADLLGSDGRVKSRGEQQEMAPGDNAILGEPGAGARWLVAAVTREQVMGLAWGGLAVVTGLGALTLYGGYAAVRDVAHRIRGRKEGGRR